MLIGNFKSRGKVGYVAAAVIVALFVVDAALFPAGAAPVGVQTARVPDRTMDPPAVPPPRPSSGALLAKGKFLVASSGIADPFFRETVVLLISYDPTGAAGLVINRPTKIPLADLLPNEPGLKKRSDFIYYGGPVEAQRMFMLIRSDEKLEESDNLFQNVYVSMSRNTLERVIEAHKTQKQFRAYSGYAGWFPGQLNNEVMRGDWYVLDADAEIIFETEESEIWHELILRSSAIEVWKHDSNERPGPSRATKAGYGTDSRPDTEHEGRLLSL
jgi:putative transcriptional regulator